MKKIEFSAQIIMAAIIVDQEFMYEDVLKDLYMIPDECISTNSN